MNKCKENIKNLEGLEKWVKSVMSDSGTKNNNQIYRDFSEHPISQVALALFSDCTRRILNLSETLTFQRVQMEIARGKIRELEDYIFLLEKKNKK